jgi:hypothetical protein
MTVVDTLRRVDRLLWRRGEARHILVDARTPVNYDMLAPVVRAMAADPRVRFTFTASQEPRRIRQIYPKVPPGSRLLGPRRAALLRWDVYLTSDFMWLALPRGAQRVQMFHGVGGKYGFDAPRESMRMWQGLFFVNERRLRNFVACGAIDPNSRVARLIGMPKVDCLVDGSIRRDAVLAGFGLDPSRPTVLYAPTWSPASSLNCMGEALLARLRDLPVNVLVKLHDRSRDLRPQYSGGVDWAGRLQPQLARWNEPGRPRRALLIEESNIAPCLVAANVMITDHSSAGFEYLLLDRPLVRIEIPELIERAQVHADYVRLIADASETVCAPEQAVAAVERALAHPDARSATRRAVASDLFFDPGRATDRCVSALYDLLELEPPKGCAPDTPGEPLTC